MKNGFAVLGIILGIVIGAFIVGGAAYLYVRSNPSTSTTPQTPSTPTAEPTSPGNETASWKTYSNSQYGFSFRYPIDSKWVPREAQGFGNTRVVDLYSDATVGRAVMLSIALTVSPTGTVDEEVNYWKSHGLKSEEAFETSTLSGKKLLVEDEGTNKKTNSTIYVFNKSGKSPAFSFGIFGADPANDQQLINTLNTIVSTFKFNP